MSKLVLRHFDPSLESFIEAGTIGGVLSQKHRGHLHPIAFQSRKEELIIFFGSSTWTTQRHPWILLSRIRT